MQRKKIIIRRESGKSQGLIGGEGGHNEGIKREILGKEKLNAGHDEHGWRRRLSQQAPRQVATRVQLAIIFTN
jgi:hypothetical protein